MTCSSASGCARHRSCARAGPKRGEARRCETVRAEVDRILGEKPDRSQLGLVALSGQPKQRLAYGEGVRLISPHAVRYLRLPEIQRTIRDRKTSWRGRG